jgi:cis-L-3-hydroxyproline dehydratase
MSGGREITSVPSTVVRVVTGEGGGGGLGETCPFGPAYLPARALRKGGR